MRPGRRDGLSFLQTFLKIEGFAGAWRQAGAPLRELPNGGIGKTYIICEKVTSLRPQTDVREPRMKWVFLLP